MLAIRLTASGRLPDRSNNLSSASSSPAPGTSATSTNICREAERESGSRGTRNGRVHLTLPGLSAPRIVISNARLGISANKDKNSSTSPRDLAASHGVSKLSSTRRHGPHCLKCATIIIDSCGEGSSPKCNPIWITKSTLVLADSQDMKCLALNLSIIVG
ncbi:hypothetical protein B0H19DRAFT_1151905 [Mycena capillaripes]|nr:hypothetical protein B0H19DRAFT_1151905 [Mycena capillaripes]